MNCLKYSLYHGISFYMGLYRWNACSAKEEGKKFSYDNSDTIKECIEGTFQINNFSSWIQYTG